MGGKYIFLNKNSNTSSESTDASEEEKVHKPFFNLDSEEWNLL
ncbi:hypothetical protein [Mycoplasma suis]|nr:hypothetical protein [Mycoplasma suis]